MRNKKAYLSYNDRSEMNNHAFMTLIFREEMFSMKYNNNYIVDVLVKYLYEKGYSPVNLSFAEILKKEVELTGLTKEKNPEEYRIACQVLGSTKRKEDPDYWIAR